MPNKIFEAASAATFRAHNRLGGMAGYPGPLDVLGVLQNVLSAVNEGKNSIVVGAVTAPMKFGSAEGRNLIARETLLWEDLTEGEVLEAIGEAERQLADHNFLSSKERIEHLIKYGGWNLDRIGLSLDLERISARSPAEGERLRDLLRGWVKEKVQSAHQRGDKSLASTIAYCAFRDAGVGYEASKILVAELGLA